MRVLSRRTAALVAVASVSLLLVACGESRQQMQVSGGDAARGREAIEKYGCVACHAIPGVRIAGGHVGPPLSELAKRAYIGGVLPNTPEDLVHWLLDPPAVDPRTAMPDLGVSETDARDIAAYLYTLD